MADRKQPRIGLIIASSGDLRMVKSCRETLERFGAPYEMLIASPLHAPERVRRWAEKAESRGLSVLIAAMGGSAPLPSAVAAHTLLPVIGLPLDASQLRGVDSLYSIIQSPPGFPVGAVGINAGENAALLALQIVATSDPALRARLAEHRAELARHNEEMCEDLYDEAPGLRPDDERAPPRPPADPVPKVKPWGATTPSPVPPAPPSPPKEPGPIAADRIAIDPRRPDPAILERAADVLLMGGVVALPTDTVYGLAADATQPKAVQRLFDIKGREAEKAIPLLIHTRLLLDLVAMDTPTEIEAVLERYWPGALTVIFRKLSDAFDCAAPGGTVGVRIPDHPVALGVISKTGRPLAVTSANRSGDNAALDAETIKQTFPGEVDLILDAGESEGGIASTTLSVAERPFRILREGAVKRSDLLALLGDNLLG